MNPTVWLIGAGPGDPELLTLKAVKALARADVVLVDDLVDPQVLQYCPQARIVRVGKRGGCRSTPQDFIQRLMLRYARQGLRVARLKGGDPCIFGRGGEEAQWLSDRGVACEIVNGITAGLAAASASGIPLTQRGLAQGVTLITAHSQDGSTPDWSGLARSGTTLVVYMGVAKVNDMSSLNRPGFRGGCLVKVKQPHRRMCRVGCSSLPQPRPAGYSRWMSAGAYG
ncbi:uroporphyrinogen-III C-methyltransferase [Achromobacter denitrificans]|nr:uroporphyrinogen-III C-methyltransferase [Achromobacter denitrificans]